MKQKIQCMHAYTVRESIMSVEAKEFEATGTLVIRDDKTGNYIDFRIVRPVDESFDKAKGWPLVLKTFKREDMVIATLKESFPCNTKGTEKARFVIDTPGHCIYSMEFVFTHPETKAETVLPPSWFKMGYGPELQWDLDLNPPMPFIQGSIALPIWIHGKDERFIVGTPEGFSWEHVNLRTQVGFFRGEIKDYCRLPIPIERPMIEGRYAEHVKDDIWACGSQMFRLKDKKLSIHIEGSV